MPPWFWWTVGAAAVLTLFVVPMVLSGIIYFKILVRTSKTKWPRGCSDPNDALTAAMYAEGMSWAEAHAAEKREVTVKSGRLTLCGEYFDFGADRSVILLPGRTETLQFGYYFGELYRRAGMNVLVIDPRAHGLSDGRVNSVGFREYRDVLAWGAFLHNTCGQKSIFLHGLCIGAETAIFTLAYKKCPAYFAGAALEGIFVNFCEMTSNHFRDFGHRPFPLVYYVMVWILLCSGGWAVTDGPAKRIGRVKAPVLFLHSREDVFSKPEKSQKVFDNCLCTHRLVWFDRGRHSRLRITDTAKYDAAVLDFLSSAVYNNNNK